MNTLITFRTESGQILRRNDYLKFVGLGNSWRMRGNNDTRRALLLCTGLRSKTRVDSPQLWSELHDVAFYCVSPKSADRFRVIAYRRASNAERVRSISFASGKKSAIAIRNEAVSIDGHGPEVQGRHLSG
jgi:hypothetical protein